MTVEGLCPARVRAWPDRDGFFACRLSPGHDDMHAATGLYAWQTIYWAEDDRRGFRGPFVPCDESTCWLPAGHAREHARTLRHQR